MIRKLLLLVVLLAFLCAVAVVLRRPPTQAFSTEQYGAPIGEAAPRVPLSGVQRAPYLQRVGPDSATIVWRTYSEIEPVVLYGSAPDALTGRVSPAAIHVKHAPGGSFDRLQGELLEPPLITIQYEARIDGLAAGSTTYYAVADGEQELAGGDADHRFRTHPAPGSAAPVRIWAFGCSGTGDPNAISVHRSMERVVEAEEREIDVWLHAGDVAYYDGLDREFQANFFEIYRPTLQGLACWPALGNHGGHTAFGPQGVGPYFDAFVLPEAGEVGGVPSGTESFYSFDYGQVHFISINSYDEDRRPEGRMAEWLRHDLAAARESAAWIVAYWHHPPYTKGSHDSDYEPRPIEMREMIMPILEEGGVDLVLHAHSHTYERSMLINGAYETPTTAFGKVLNDGDGHPGGDGAYRKPAGITPHAGLVSVVVGTGGGYQYRRGTMPLMRETFLGFGSLFLDIEENRCTGRMISAAGELLDTFAMVKEGAEIAQPIERPWQPVGPVILPSVSWFMGEIEVTIDSVTRWPAEQIHFTVDGSEPTHLSPRYTGAIPIHSETRVRARAIDPQLGYESPVTEAQFIPYVEALLPAAHIDPAALAPGLAFNVYSGKWARLPDFSTLTPDRKGIVRLVTSRVQDGEHFGLSFNGYISVPADDVYTFYLVSDDGSRLLVDGQLVVDNDGLHASRELSGPVGLAAGHHAVQVDFFEAGGAEWLAVAVQTATMKKQTVPRDWWFHSSAVR